MTLYEFLLAVHILAAVVWVGGSFAIQLLAMRSRRRGPVAFGQFAQDIEWYGQRFNLGSSLVLIISAFALAAEGDWPIGDFWLSFAIGVWILSFILGAGYLGPRSKKVGQELEASGGTPTAATQDAIGKLFLASRIELVLLILVVLDMAIKPGT